MKVANEYVAAYHRHHKPARGSKFCVSVEDENDERCGVAICGRPVSRYLDESDNIHVGFGNRRKQEQKHSKAK